MSKTWVEKRDCGRNPQVKVLKKSFAGMPIGCKMLISSPHEVDGFIRKIPAGSTLSAAEMRMALAKRHNADATCPVSTGIFLRIVAEAALEERNSGKNLKEITPFWRIAIEATSTLAKLGIDGDEINYLRELDH